MGAEGVTRTKLLGGLDQGGDLERGQEVRFGTAEGGDQATGRHLGVGEDRPEIGEEAPGHAQALGGPAGPPLA